MLTFTPDKTSGDLALVSVRYFPDPQVRFDLSTPFFTIFGVKQMQLTAGKQLTLLVQPVDQFGNDARVDGITSWSVEESVPGISILEVAGDGLSAILTSTGKVGDILVKVTADADLSEGIVPISGALSIEVIADQAVGFETLAEPVSISMAPAPAEAPAAEEQAPVEAVAEEQAPVEAVAEESAPVEQPSITDETLNAPVDTSGAADEAVAEEQAPEANADDELITGRTSGPDTTAAGVPPEQTVDPEPAAEEQAPVDEAPAAEESAPVEEAAVAEESAPVEEQVAQNDADLEAAVEESAPAAANDAPAESKVTESSLF
jgi:hypothetical protein